MTGLEFVLMCFFTVVGVKYVIDMIKYSKGYEINGKCRYGRKYARELAEKRQNTCHKAETQMTDNVHDDISKLISSLTV